MACPSLFTVPSTPSGPHWHQECFPDVWADPQEAKAHWGLPLLAVCFTPLSADALWVCYMYHFLSWPERWPGAGWDNVSGLPWVGESGWVSLGTCPQEAWPQDAGPCPSLSFWGQDFHCHPDEQLGTWAWTTMFWSTRKKLDHCKIKQSWLSAYDRRVISPLGGLPEAALYLGDCHRSRLSMPFSRVSSTPPSRSYELHFNALSPASLCKYWMLAYKLSRC